MSIETKTEEHLKLFKTITNREILEEKALAQLTSEVLQKLNLSIERLPRKCQTLLKQLSQRQVVLGLQTLDPISISQYRTNELSDKLEDEYEILKLKKKNQVLQMKIDRNNKFIMKLKKDLECSRHSLFSRDPNPDNIQDYIRQLKPKLTAYEDSYELVKTKYFGLNVPETILPKSLNSQIDALRTLREEAIQLKQQADDVTFLRETKATLYKLRK